MSLLSLTCLMFAIFCCSTSVNAGGECRVVCPAPLLRTKVGDTVDFPCYFDPNVSAAVEVEWSRNESNFKPQEVFIQQNGFPVDDRYLNAQYRQRCSLSNEKLDGGDVSLQLRTVQFADDGTYKCMVPDLRTELHSNKSCLIKLHVGKVSEPTISSAGPNDGGSSLWCDSGCWYPQPEMSWLDSEDIELAAEDPVIHRPSEHCYVVQSNLTAKGTGRFTCRVHLPHINHTAEANHDITLSPGRSAGHFAGPVVGVIAVCMLGGALIWLLKQKGFCKKMRRQDFRVVHGAEPSAA